MLILIIFALFFKLKAVKDVQGPNFQALNDTRVETDSKNLQVRQALEARSKKNDCSEKIKDLEKICEIKNQEKAAFKEYLEALNMFLKFFVNITNQELFEECKKKVEELKSLIQAKKCLSNFMFKFLLASPSIEQQKKIFETEVSFENVKSQEIGIEFLTPIVDKMQKIFSDIEKKVEIDLEGVKTWLKETIEQAHIKISRLEKEIFQHKQNLLKLVEENVRS